MGRRRARAIHPAGWAAIVAVGALAASPQAAARPSQIRPTSPSTVVVALSAMPDGTNPLVTDDQYSADVEALLYDPLYYETPTLTYAPDLATAWDVGARGRAYTYTLNPKARWTSGRPVDAADVVASLKAYASARDTGAERGRFADLLSVTALGTERVEVTLRHPDPAWPGVLAGLPILPAPAPRSRTTAKTGPVASAKGAVHAAQPPATDGPYVLTHWDAQSGLISLAANAAYFRGAPRVARIELRVVPAPQGAFAALRKGAVQVAILPPTLAAAARKAPGLTSRTVSGMGLALVAFNVTAAALRPAAVRRALSLAVDRAAVMRAAGVVGAQVPNGPWPAVFDGVAPPTAGYDPALARSLLHKAGWRPGAGGVLRRDGRRLALTLRYPAGSGRIGRAAVSVASAWRRLGVAVALDPEPFVALESAAASGRYQALLMGAVFGQGVDLAALVGGRADFPPAGQDIARYDSPLVRAVLSSGAQSAAAAVPPPTVFELVASLLDRNPPYLPLWSDTSLVVTSATLSGFTPNPAGPDLYQPQLWTLP